MNEFEWLRQMRALNRPVTPRDDLWLRIDAAIDETASAPVPLPVKPTHALRTWSMAAAVAGTFLLVGGVVWQFHINHAAISTPVASAPVAEISPTWKPDDPRLAGAAIELDAAQMELRQAIQQAPESPALQRLLQRTDDQQTQLRLREKEAG